ncbi:MAG: 2-oxoacid:ferredoxin oxidoreductase subunit beta [Solirubrobacteraceae bacterium]|nr:2-oxoacid:ferredoxin oxidoreductase subunit beta [Solirubrobacteraceae bacterium]
MSTTAEPTGTLTRADFQSDQETRWCPGCGDYAILAAVQGVMPDIGIPPERVAFITGIGCAGRFSYYMDTYGMHSIHGRAPTIATGLVAARDDLSVWIVSGDGDALSIGGNHLIHALRRDVPVKILLFNNRIYGLTKGQASPTSERGKVTKSTPDGSLERPVNPLATAIAAGATFAARAVDRDKAGLADVLRAAAEHPGAAFVEILQNCPVFNDGAFSHVQDKDEAVLHRIPLEPDRPLRFGRDGDQAVIRGDDGGLRIVPGAEADDASVVVHDPTIADPTAAFALSQLGVDTGHVPLGVLRRVPSTPWGEGLVAERRAALSTVDDAQLDRLLAGPDTWTVGGGPDA